MTGAEEIAVFLVQFAPFRELDAHHLEELAATVRPATYPADAAILRQTAEPADHLFVIRSGAVALLEEGRLVERLGPGEVFGLSVLSGTGPAMSVRAEAPTECYLIEAEQARDVLGSPAGLAFLTQSMARWRERDSAREHARRTNVPDDLAEEIGRAPNVSEVVAASGQLPSVVRSLLEEGTDPIDIGHVVGLTIDRLTTRLLELSIRDAGEPPVPFSWVALGSAARHEQALGSDQDHAIAFGCGDDEAEAVDPFFAKLATAVTEGLEACGIERCRGGVMAENSAWRRTVDGWGRRFAEYVADREVMGTRIAGIAFDYRRVVGAVSVEPALDAVIRGARSDRAFQARLRRTVLETKPPVGRFKDVVTERGGPHGGTVDVKHGAITPITNLARYYAISAGISENRTVERLRGAASATVISEARRHDLEEAFRLSWRIRLEHHVEQIKAGVGVDDHVDPTTLRAIERRSFGAALQVIAQAQEDLARA